MRDLKQLPKLVGAKQSKKALDDGQVAALIVARDAQQTVTAPLVEQAARQDVPVEWGRQHEGAGALVRHPGGGRRCGAAPINAKALAAVQEPDFPSGKAKGILPFRMGNADAIPSKIL